GSRFQEGEPSPLGEGIGEGFASFERADPEDEAEQLERLAAWRRERDEAGVRGALDTLRRAAEGSENLVPASVQAAVAGATTGEWAGALREIFGAYRAPTGVTDRTLGGGEAAEVEDVRRRVRSAAERMG